MLRDCFICKTLVRLGLGRPDIMHGAGQDSLLQWSQTCALYSNELCLDRAALHMELCAPNFRTRIFVNLDVVLLLSLSPG